MAKLEKFMLKKGYSRISLKRISTNHYQLEAKINDKKGCFILDTGASNTCVDLDKTDYFMLSSKKSDIKAAGAGGTGLNTHISKKNLFEIGSWKRQKQAIILFNMMHVNAALAERSAKPVDGIIGADVLKKAKAVIDYNKNCIYLKTQNS